MKKLCLTLMCFMMLLSQLVLPVMAAEEPFDVNSLVESYRYTKDSETGTRSFHEDHGIGFTLPSAYSAVEDGLVTSIKNQGRTGMCWAFALIGSMESNAIKRGLTDLGTSLDLSEAHLAKNSFRYEADTLGLNAKDSVTPRSELEFIDMGFSVVHGLFTLTRGMGPVRESQAPFSYDYQQMSDNVMNGTFYHREFTLQNGIVPWMFDEESVKRLVYENGAVACAYRSNGDEYYGYVKSGGMPNHGAQIVGWDDSIDRNKFLPEPASQDGAWLIKNSWGNSAAYFWLSYDSTVSEVMSAEMAPQDAYDYKYHYDMANFSTEYDLQAGEEVKIANIFTTQKTTAIQTERIHAVSVGFASMNTVYSLQLYKNPVGDNPESGTPLLDEPLQGVKIHRGFYTISLPQSFEVARNDQIAVVFTIKNRNRNHIASIEVSESFDGYNYQTKEVTEPNQSFIKRANQSWKDMHEEQKVIRIQMLTNVDSENTVGTKSLKKSDMHLRDTLLTYSGECVEPIVIIDNDELKEMMHYGIRYENNLNVGTGKVIVYGVNEYEGSSVELPFTIQGTTFDHELFNVSYEQEHIQTGSQVRPQVSVTYYDRILKEGQDYEIQYGTNLVDNETDNDGSFTIIGKGSYTGEKTYYFNIRNPKYNKQIQVFVSPGDVAIAAMSSQAYVGEDIMLTVGNTNWNYAFIDWEVDGITFNRSQDSDRLNVYDDIVLKANFIKRIDMVELLNRYNEFNAMNLNENDYNPSQWALFEKEMEFAGYLLMNFDDNDMRMTQSLYFLNLAYENLNHDVDRSAAQAYLAQLEKDLPKWEESETLSWAEFMYQYELLKAAVTDIDITQAKLDEFVNRTRTAQGQIVSKDGNETTELKKALNQLYQEKLNVQKDLYTTSSVTQFEVLLKEAQDLLAQSNPSKEDLQSMFERLSNVKLTEKGNASTLKSLLDEIQTLNEDLYEETSFASLMNAYQDAHAIYEARNDKSQAQLDQAYHTLDAVYKTLATKPVEPEINKDALKELLELADAMISGDIQYTNASFDALYETYSQAEDVYNNSNSQDEINAMAKELDEAIKALKEKLVIDDVYVEALTDTTITLRWIPESEGFVRYELYDFDTDELLAETTQLTYTFTGLTPETNYSILLVGYDKDGNESIGLWIPVTTKEELKAPEKVEGLEAEMIDYKTISLSWEPSESALGYDIYRKGYEENASFEYLDTVDGNSYEVSNLMTGKTYTFYVVAKNEAGASEKSESVAIATTLKGKVKLNITQVSDATFKLSWNKIAGASRYIIYSKRNDDSYKKVLTLNGSTLEYVTKELPEGNYSYIVRAGRYDSVDRVMTDKSNAVKAKVIYLQPKLKLKAGTKKIQLSWEKVEGVTYYEVYRATKFNGKYTKLKTVKETSFTATSLVSNKEYFFKVRGYKTYDNGETKEKIYTPFSEVRSLKAK